MHRNEELQGSDNIPRDHYRGKWTVKRILREAIEAHDGEMPLEDLLNHLQKLGYDKEAIRSRLRPLNIEVVGGVARLRG